MTTRNRLSCVPLLPPRASAQSVGGLNLVSLQDLTSLAELAALTQIRMHLVVLWCRKLVDLQGLENVRAMDSTMWIESNPLLQSLDGLQVGALKRCVFWV